MLLLSTRHLTRATLTFGVTLAFASLLHASEEKIFTQKPEIAPAQVRGEPAVPMPKETRPRSDPFKHGPTPLWIWGADDNRRYVLRKEFAGGSTAARLKATCDNRMKITLNGRKVMQSDDWQTPVERDVQKFLKPGNNVLIAEVENEGGIAGFLLKLVLTTPKEDALRRVG